MSIVKVNQDEEELAQAFLGKRSHAGASLSFSSADIIKDDNISLIARINQGQQVIKLVKPRTWHERPKLYWGHSAFNKEINGNRALHRLGIHVPSLVEYGFGLLPARDYQYLGYYVMENLEKEGLQDAATLFRSGSLSDDARQELFLSIVRDLATMRYHRLLYSDLRLSNVFTNAEGQITWIDTGATLYSLFSRRRYQKKFKQSVRKMLRPYIKDMHEEELSHFENLLRGK